ncbi:uncharacterized protein LOC142235917 [Haematobia irritans]|uniref:uncharacterized protein LOC142235917 n=1 Tax=Haematobia irritans TaxID=7368 RepID=UPI003F50156E
MALVPRLVGKFSNTHSLGALVFRPTNQTLEMELVWQLYRRCLSHDLFHSRFQVNCNRHALTNSVSISPSGPFDSITGLPFPLGTVLFADSHANTPKNMAIQQRLTKNGQWMMHFKMAFAFLALAVMLAQAKPSLPYGFHGVPDHIDLAPPAHLHQHQHLHHVPQVYGVPPAHIHHQVPELIAPEAHFHQAPPVLPPAHFHEVAAPAPIYPGHAHLLPAPAPLLPAPAPLLPAAAHFVPAPTPVVHTHVLPAPAPVLPAPVHVTKFLPPVLEAIPFTAPVPHYRAIPGPKTTTHHVSVGYAFPHAHAHFAKAIVHPHAHLHAAPLALAPHHHHHHTLF